MDKIKTVKIKNEDGSISEETYTISVDALNVDMANNKNLQETIGTINIDTDGNIAYQLENLKNNKVNKTDIIDNLNSAKSDKVLSANQGKVLKDTITILNEDVKKKAYYFNTIADMKNADLKIGDYACTLGHYEVNDGGGATYKITNIKSETDYQEELENGLYATLIVENYVIPEMFGAYGDGVHDDTNILQYVIDNYDNIILNREYNVTNINVNNTINLKINKLNGNITLKNSGINLEFNIISNGGIIIDDTYNLIQKCNIKGYRINNDSGYGIYLHASSKGIQYNHFDVMVIRGNKAICFDKTSNTWINNNHFKNMTLAGNIGIDVLTTNQDYDANCFYNIAFEDINKWFNLNGFKNTIIDNPRMIPYEAHQQAIDPSNKLGTMARCYNISFNGLSNGIWCNYIEISSSDTLIVKNPLTDGGSKIGDSGLWNGTIYTHLTQNNFKKGFYKLSELSSTFTINLSSCDVTKPVEILLDTNKYLYININTSNDFKEYITNLAIPYIDIHFIGSQTAGMDIAYRNTVKKTIPANTQDATYRYYFGS